jgi:hypothetical protein
MSNLFVLSYFMYLKVNLKQNRTVQEQGGHVTEK